MLIDLLANLPQYQIGQAARAPDRERGKREDGLRPRIAALMTSYFQVAPVAFGWQRLTPGGPIDVFTAGRTVVRTGHQEPQGTRRDDVLFTFPPGARGWQLPAQHMLTQLQTLPNWVRVNGLSDLPSKDGPADIARSASFATLEDCLVEAWTGPFAWLLVGLPVPRDEIQQRRDSLAKMMPEQRLVAKQSQEFELDRERDDNWHRELRRGELIGLWRMHVLVGGETPDAAAHLAALYCGATDVGRLPYMLTPDSDPARTLSEWLSTLTSPKGVMERRGTPESPFLASTELLAALGRPPLRELYGLRLRRPPDFDIMPESPGEIALWPILDQNMERAGELSVTHATLLRHTFVCGATGSGKSQTVRALLERVSQSGVPWLVIEPAKREYADGMAGRLGPNTVLVLRPGDPELTPVSLNPLEPADGFPLQSHLDMTRALFLAAFDAEEPFPQVLAQALIRCYERRGWNLARGRPAHEWFPPSDHRPTYPTLAELQAACSEVVGRIGYSQEVRDNVRGYVDVRIGSLRLGSSGRFFEGGHPLDFAALLRQNVVLEMENLTNDQDKAFLIGVVLIRLVEHLQVEYRREQHKRRHSGHYETGNALRHLTVVEEAHRLLRNAPPEQTTAAHAVEVFASLLAEIRAYGEGIVVAEQIPSKIFPDVLKNTALKIVHRLPAADDRSAVGATMNLTTEQSEYVVTLQPGIAATFADGMDRPVLAATPLGENREGGIAVDVAPLTGRRSATCGGACQAQPCSMNQMQTAERVIALFPRLALLVEVGLVTHLTGAGRFRIVEEGWLRYVRRFDARTLQCAIADLAQASVDARYQYLVEFFNPDALARHIAESTLHLIAPLEQPDVCEPAEVKWRAGRYRLLSVIWTLERKNLAHEKLQELVRQWHDIVGLDLGTGERDEQLENARAHPWAHYRYQRELLWGEGDPPRLASAASLSTPVAGQRAALDKALGFVVSKDKTWLLDRLFAV